MKRESLLVVSTNGLAERIWLKLGLNQPSGLFVLILKDTLDTCKLLILLQKCQLYRSRES